MREKLSKAVNVVKKIPDKKNHLDFLAAALTIPVLISVIILNYSNLQKPKASPATSPTPTITETTKPQYIIVPSGNQNNNPSPTSSTCIKDIGPIDVTFPKEGDTVGDNPLCINISYTNTNYCSVVWSYRINGGTWSDYTSNNPCIYNLQNGSVKFDLKVQSTVSQNQTSLSRNFTYKGQNVNTPTPSGTSSASLNQ